MPIVPGHHHRMVGMAIRFYYCSMNKKLGHIKRRCFKSLTGNIDSAKLSSSITFERYELF